MMPSAKRHWRFADGIIDHGRHRWIGVREDHTGAGQPVNAIVGVDLAQPGTAAGHIIAAGQDFFASPRLSHDGRCLAWLAWDHPNMPWNGTTLYLAALDENGAIIGAVRRTPVARLNRSSSLNGRRMTPTSFSSRIVRAGGIFLASR